MKPMNEQNRNRKWKMEWNSGVYDDQYDETGIKNKIKRQPLSIIEPVVYLE